MISAIAPHFIEIRSAHVGCVALSGTLFALRGVLHARGRPLANHIALRIGSHLIDSTLLGTAVLLAVILRQYPFVHGWLTAKVLLLFVYIALGSVTLKRARTPSGRLIALAAALSTFAVIIGIAVAHDPPGWLRLMHT